MNNQPEFYVGYLPMPAGVRRFVRRIAALIGVLTAGVAILLVFEQSPFADSSFEYRDYRAFQGVLSASPYPTLVDAAGAPWLLVSPGKHGFADSASGLVRLRGERIVRGPDRMIEVVPGSVERLGEASSAPEIELGPATLTGEIVDSKCYFGVMNPGNGKVHRDCAARCLRGGIPPALVVRDAAGKPLTFLLANWRSELLEHVAEPVTLRGRVTRSNGRLTLHAE